MIGFRKGSSIVTRAINSSQHSKGRMRNYTSHKFSLSDIRGIKLLYTYSFDECMLVVTRTATKKKGKKQLDSSELDDQEQPVDRLHKSQSTYCFSEGSRLSKSARNRRNKRERMAESGAAEILLNERGERINADGARVDKNGDVLEDEWKLVKDELKPDDYFENKSAIVLPRKRAEVFKLENRTISFFRDRKFSGFKNKNPMDHIGSFEGLVGNFVADGISFDWMCCKLFSHTITYKALTW